MRRSAAGSSASPGSRTRAVLPLLMAQETARIHSIALEHVPFFEGPQQLPSTPTVLDRLEEMLDGPELQPPIEHGVRWLRDHRPTEHRVLLIRADLRLGKLHGRR